MYVDFFKSNVIRLNKSDLSKQLLRYICNFYEPLLEQINPYKLGEKKRKSDISVAYAQRILVQYNNIDKNTRNNLVDYLVTACPEHGYVIDYKLMSLFLPNVKQSKDFGSDYEQKLTELSLYFIKDDSEDKYIGFVPKLDTIEEVKQDTEKVIEYEIGSKITKLKT